MNYQVGKGDKSGSYSQGSQIKGKNANVNLVIHSERDHLVYQDEEGRII
jgi:hypothetical protein